MIQMRWLQRPVEGEQPQLQYRYRLGGVSIVRTAIPVEAGLRMDPNEGWSAWEDVPTVQDWE